MLSSFVEELMWGFGSGKSTCRTRSAVKLCALLFHGVIQIPKHWNQLYVHGSFLLRYSFAAKVDLEPKNRGNDPAQLLSSQHALHLWWTPQKQPWAPHLARYVQNPRMASQKQGESLVDHEVYRSYWSFDEQSTSAKHVAVYQQFENKNKSGQLYWSTSFPG